MAALVDQQRFFESLWSRKPILQLDSLVPVVTLHSTSFSSSGDSDITQSNTNSVIKIDEDDDLPLSTFLPLKSIPLTNNSNNNNNNSNNNDHSMNHKDEIVHPLCQCTKPAVLDDPRWDGQFCSPECLIRVCHEAFNVWLENHHCVKEDTVIEH
ncbi:unnamed protein product [Heterobilharzia americana]|nr:unnamed protein product [Heterobilharzia americana]